MMPPKIDEQEKASGAKKPAPDQAAGIRFG
jgi:hypothetical protein